MQELSNSARTMSDDREQGEREWQQQFGKTRASRVFGLCLHGLSLIPLTKCKRYSGDAFNAFDAEVIIFLFDLQDHQSANRHGSRPPNAPGPACGIFIA